MAAAVVKTSTTALNVFKLRSAIKASMLGQSKLKRNIRRTKPSTQ